MSRSRDIRRPAWTRRGFTLIEVVAASAVSGVLMGIAVSLATLAMRMDRTSRAHLEASLSRARLSSTWRADLEAGPVVTPAPVGLGTQITLDYGAGHTIEWRVLGSALVRQESQGGQPGRRERFELAKGSLARFSPLAPPGRWRLEWGPPAAAGQPLGGWRIEASGAAGDAANPTANPQSANSAAESAQPAERPAEPP